MTRNVIPPERANLYSPDVYSDTDTTVFSAIALLFLYPPRCHFCFFEVGSHGIQAGRKLNM